MSSFTEYESLKSLGTWRDCIRYARSYAGLEKMETYLKLSTSDDDMRTLLFVSVLTKNKMNLLDLFETNSLAIRRRMKAAEAWIRLENDETLVKDFIVNTIKNQNFPPRIKHRILQCIPQQCRSKKFSETFYYDLACRLTESYHHEQFNIDSNTLTYCSTYEQIKDLLSRWHLLRFNQISKTSPLRSKLIRYQPLVAIELIQNDLELAYGSDERLHVYFEDNRELFTILSQHEPKAMCRFALEHLKRLEKHKHLLPEFIHEKHQRIFAKAPDEMIELILLAATHQPGSIKYQSRWTKESSEVSSFSFPRSFSVHNYVKLFIGFYHTCKWSLNHVSELLKLTLRHGNKNIYSIRKQSQWFFETVVKQEIGNEEFLKVLFKQASIDCLPLLVNYPDLCRPLARHLLSRLDHQEVVRVQQRIQFLHYEQMTSEVFDKLVALFQENSSDVYQRKMNYPLLLQCAFFSSADQVSKALHWIEKRLKNEQLLVIESFILHLGEYDDRFHFQLVQNNFDSIAGLIHLALNHLQCTLGTIQTILEYAIKLLTRAEHCLNKEKQKILHEFACKIIRRCYSIDNNIPSPNYSLKQSIRIGSNLLANILTADAFPRLISKGLIEEFWNLLTNTFDKPWRQPQIDNILESFFFHHLRTSEKLQQAFKIDENSNLIEMFLKQRTMRFARAQKLLSDFGEVCILNPSIQKIIVSSEQYRSLIDRLIVNDKSVTIDKLIAQDSLLYMSLNPSTKNSKIPGLHVDILGTCYDHLTGIQQDHVIKIILEDYLQDNEVSNLNKLKALRIIRRMPRTYHFTFQWLKNREQSPAPSLTSKTSRIHCIRGADAQSIDDIVICVPASFDLSLGDLIYQFNSLRTRLNAANAKYISNAMLAISRKLPDEMFLKLYLDLVRNEQFQKFGITAAKEVLRLLMQYKNSPFLFEQIIQPLWASRPHQDVRACLIDSVLYFFDKLGRDETSPIWSTLREAAHDDYLPVIEKLFVRVRGQSEWTLTRLANSDVDLFRKFVEEIQFRVLDHPKKLEARIFGWSRVDYEHCDQMKLYEKVKNLCVHFDRNANTLWKIAFKAIIASIKQAQQPSSNIIVDLIKSLVSLRKIDDTENALDSQHDLPIYHRVSHLLDLLASEVNELRIKNEEWLRTVACFALEFDATLAPRVGQILIGLVGTKEELHAVLVYLQNSLDKYYFRYLVGELGSELVKENSFCQFIEKLSIAEKLELVEWFVQKQQESFVFYLFRDKLLSEANADRERCRTLLRQIRQSGNMYVRQHALQLTVTWDDTFNESITS